MNDRDRLWRCIREAAASYEAPDHLSDTHLRSIARSLCCGVAPINVDQAALGLVPDFMEAPND